jgi:hypothetical protein
MKILMQFLPVFLVVPIMIYAGHDGLEIRKKTTEACGKHERTPYEEAVMVFID